MLIIPVIDLLNGMVVHARQGDRDHYQNVTSVLTQSAEPEDVLAGYYKLYPFKVIYLADLNAIQNRNNHFQLIKDICHTHPDTEFWLDAGMQGFEDDSVLNTCPNLRFIFGSENGIEQDSLSELFKQYPKTVLSLDFNEQGLINNPYLMQQPGIWPEKVIVMQLNRVGSTLGVAYEKLNEIKQLNTSCNIYAAGGIQSVVDLEQLQKDGMSGALLASALHNGNIGHEDISRFISDG